MDENGPEADGLDDESPVGGTAGEERMELARLWVSAQPSISAYLMSFVSDFHVAQDLMQEVAEAVAQQFHKYDRDRSFLTWTLGIARRRAMRHFRTQARDKLVFSSETMDSVAAAFERAEPIEQSRREALRFCLGEVEGRRLEVLEMRYRADMTPMAIAKRLGVTSESIRGLLLRTRRALQACVSKRMALKGAEQ